MRRAIVVYNVIALQLSIDSFTLRHLVIFNALPFVRYRHMFKSKMFKLPFITHKHQKNNCTIAIVRVIASAILCKLIRCIENDRSY